MKYEAYGYTKNEVVRAPIDAARYFDIKTAKGRCLFALELEEKFALLIDNLAEYECELLRLAESYLLRGYLDHTASMQERLCLDRRLVNLLTACRLYLDQTDHGISSLFGKSSAELANIKIFKNDLYDKHWGYRLMEALRNHVQHSGLIVHIISYTQFRSPGKGPDYTEFIICPQTKVSTLAEDASFKKEILSELESRGDKIDLRGPARDYLSCFVQLHEKLRKVIQARTLEARKLYERAVKDFLIIDAQEVRCASLRELHEDERKVNEVELVTEFLNYYDQLVKRNVVNKKLEHSTASNTDQKQA
ncbi:MAG: hypothetical protein L6437_03595 [Kiritimatiellae bacterium]|nr:hypothetical protein [Kiritimatiellia bacterium]